VAACLVYCVSRPLYRMSLAMDVRCATYSLRLILKLYVAQRTSIARLILYSIRLTQYTRHAVTAPTQRNDVNHCVFLNYNFSKEQCMLPEDDRMIETCRSVLRF